ncbi:MAG: SPOR domain-containing protein [Tenacibaculum sp.]
MKKHKFLFTFIIMLATSIFTGYSQENQANNKDIISLIEKKRAYNKHNGTGFRIQLYNGLERTAKSLRGKFQVEFPGTYTKLSYDAPEWKIQVGNYKTRLHADRALNEIREKFSGAIVVPL